jgi:hypothetical protein
MFGSSLSPVICRRAHVLHYLCLLARSVSNSYCVVLCCVVLCCVVLCCVVLCCVVLCCVVLCCVVLCCVFVLFVFIMFAPMLPVSMDCPFLIPLQYSLTFILDMLSFSWQSGNTKDTEMMPS